MLGLVTLALGDRRPAKFREWSHRVNPSRSLGCRGFCRYHRLREWLDHHPDDKLDTSPFDLEAIQINPRLSPERIAKIKDVIRRFAHVFEGHENSLPKPFATEPITLKFKKDAKPQSVPQPRWTFAQKEVVRRWAEEGLRNGSLEPSTSAWASRVHLVLKPPANQTAELADLKDCKLRPFGDYRLVNTQIEKIAPNLPTARDCASWSKLRATRLILKRTLWLVTIASG